MAWAGPSSDKPVWCAQTGKGGPTSQSVACTTTDPNSAKPELAMLQSAPGAMMMGPAHPVSDVDPSAVILPASYQKFTSQIDLGKYLTAQYHIRTGNELSSCEVCHR